MCCAEALFWRMGCFELSGEGGDDEAAESGIELVGSCAEELGIGAGNMLAGCARVLDITLLPPGEAVRVGHLRLALADSLGEGADGTFAALGERAGVRIHNSIGVGAAIAGAHDDAFLSRKPATEVVEGESGLNFSHRVRQ